ncbi:MAG: LCP family protein [Actinomycetota bacterium]|nr:LCP family protein [Actinomycetota bacterium]
MPRSSRRRWPRILAAIAAGAVLVTAVIGAGVNHLIGQLQGNITTLDVSEELGTTDANSPLVFDENGNMKPLNLMILGSDSRTGKGNGGFGKPGQFGGERSDTAILLHVSADRGNAVAVSIPRDTLISYSCTKKGKTVSGTNVKFNEAFTFGGPGCTLKVVNEMTGMNITNFVKVDFGGFKKIVNAIGGVEICLAKPVNDPKSGLKLSAGKHLVTGNEALAFVRARKTLGDGSDTSRIRRQQAFISSLSRKVLSSGTLLNPASLIGLLNAATESLTANPQMADLQNLKELALSMKDIRPADITFLTMPWKPAGDGANVVENVKKARPVWKAMINDTAYPPKTTTGQPTLSTPPSGIYIDVLNGTATKGLAKKVAKQLKAEGYRVQGVGNAPAPVTATTVTFDPKWDTSAKTLTWAASAKADATGKGQRMTLTIGPDFTSIKPVVISAAAGDVYSNLNTGDESFCAS